VGGQQFVVEAARAEDGAAIQEISRRHEALSAASRLAEWWRSNPQIFRAVREQSDAIAGFYCMFDPTTVSSDDLETDLIPQQWRRHLRGNSAPKNKRVLMTRGSGITVIAVSQLIEGRRGRLGQTSPLSVGYPDTLGRPFDSDSALAQITFQPAGQKCLDFRGASR
jgi:hypothetical protein